VTPTFFRTAGDLRRWLEKNHASTTELWLGMYKKGSGKPSVTYSEALDEALCFGWIDGVRKSLDEDAFVQRFTPRRPKSYWSAVNIKRANALKKAGRMHASGLAAFARRDKTKPERYSFERATAQLDPALEKRFKANAEAWRFFESSAPWYRRVATHWVTSAKKEETRLRRLETLIRDSAEGRRIGLLAAKKTT
jgi:uncharacterized protein YdeI (YjbR/CyaY-like superfamily)